MDENTKNFIVTSLSYLIFILSSASIRLIIYNQVVIFFSVLRFLFLSLIDGRKLAQFHRCYLFNF